MKSESNDARDARPAKGSSLAYVLKQSECIKDTVEQAVNELILVNETLQQDNKNSDPVQTITEAIMMNEDVEHKLAKAADDLSQVNTQLKEQVADREGMASELADTGDKVLLMVANRLQSSLREGDTVSRWGGDEFVCLVLEVKQEADVRRLAGKLAGRIAEACECNGNVLSVNASIGIAIYPADGRTADILFKNADEAMFRAKRTKKNAARSSEHPRS